MSIVAVIRSTLTPAAVLVLTAPLSVVVLVLVVCERLVVVSFLLSGTLSALTI